LKCEDFDRLFHLYYDDQLDEAASKEIKAHFQECKRCSEKLEALKSIEKVAKDIELQEPEEGYWESFSQRVRNKIVLREKKPFGLKVKSLFESLTTISPSKLKLAASLATLVLVFIIGKLYIDYRIAGLEKLRYPMSTKVTIVPPQVSEEKKKEFQAEENKIVSQKKIEARKVEKPPAKVEKMKPAKEVGAGLEREIEQIPPAAKEERMADMMKAGPEVTTEAPVNTAKMAVAPKETSMAKPSEAFGIAKIEGVTEKGKSKTSKIAIMAEKTYPDTTMKKIGYEIIGMERVGYLSENDTLISPDSLKKIIEVWKDFIDKNPKDPSIDEGYQQVAIGYLLLGKITKDKSEIENGIKLIEKYLKLTKTEQIKQLLKKTEEELKSSKKK
jgi:hypothetical protein